MEGSSAASAVNNGALTAEFIEMIKAEPRRFIAQEIIAFVDLDILGEHGVTPVPRKADN